MTLSEPHPTASTHRDATAPRSVITHHSTEGGEGSSDGGDGEGGGGVSHRRKEGIFWEYVCLSSS